MTQYLPAGLLPTRVPTVDELFRIVRAIGYYHHGMLTPSEADEVLGTMSVCTIVEHYQSDVPGISGTLAIVLHTGDPGFCTILRCQDEQWSVLYPFQPI